MSDKLSRRDFVKAGTAASVVATVPAAAFGQAPTVLVRRATPPVVISSGNGHEYRNGGPRTCVEEAFQRIVKGEDVLDSLVAGVNIVELDPDEMYVGYGGLPNADGVVQLDSCCMHGPLKRAGGVAASRACARPRGSRRPSSTTPTTTCWSGRGRRRSPARWASRSRPTSTPTSRGRGGSSGSGASTRGTTSTRRSGRTPPRPRAARWWRTGSSTPATAGARSTATAVGPKGEVCGVTTTSGLAFKIPGRVGDSPILGAGLWVDDAVGAAGSTGRGEANLYNLSSFFIVEEMRRGRSPKDAAMEALKRVKANTVEKRLLDARGNPSFQLIFYAVNKKGEYAGVSMYAREGQQAERFAVCTEKGPELLACEPLLGEAPAA